VFIRGIRVVGLQPEAEAAFAELLALAFVQAVAAGDVMASGELPAGVRGH
jgi:hypothetical protein